jgi:hypothetical protein
MENNESLSANDSLKLIESMIYKAQNRFSENGTLYLLWGWLVFFCSIGQYVLIKYFNQVNNSGIIWSLTWVLAIYQIIYLRKKKKIIKVRTYTDEIIAFVWITFVVCMALGTFIIAQKADFKLIISMLLLFYGIPTFLSGVIMRFTPLKIGGVACWALALISVFINSIEILLLLPFAMLCAWIIPGYIFRAKDKLV